MENHKGAKPITSEEPAVEIGVRQRIVTIGRSAYAILTSVHEKNKVKLLERENIRTLTEYARTRLLRGVEGDILEGRFEVTGRHDDTHSVMDYHQQVEAEVVIRQGRGPDRMMEVYCRHDRSANCDHVGFLLADADVMKRALGLGVVLRKTGKPEDVREALCVFEILSAASEDGFVEEGAFLMSLTKNGKFTKQHAREVIDRLGEQGDIHSPRAHLFKASREHRRTQDAD
jgi:hypothetical protein